MNTDLICLSVHMIREASISSRSQSLAGVEGTVSPCAVSVYCTSPPPTLLPLKSLVELSPGGEEGACHMHARVCLCVSVCMFGSKADLHIDHRLLPPLQACEESITFCPPPSIREKKKTAVEKIATMLEHVLVKRLSNTHKY